MEPKQVRQRILDEHCELRVRLGALVDDPTVERVLDFVERLEAHLGVEDEILEPLLRTIDAWGPERARQLREEHAAQRRELHWIRRHVHAPNGAELRPWLRRFADRLERDMAAEERERLSAELLDDGTVRVDFGG
jgi:hypothetical protein